MLWAIPHKDCAVLPLQQFPEACSQKWEHASESGIILLQTKEKYADKLSVAIRPSATRLCSQEESCLKRSCPASIFTQYAAKFAEKARVDAYMQTASDKYQRKDTNFGAIERG